MKRPLGLIGFFYFSALVFAVRLGETFSLMTAIFLLVAGSVTLFFRSLRSSGVFPCALFSVGIACLMVAFFWNILVYPVQSLENSELPVRATITSDGEDHGNYFIYTTEMTTKQEPERTFRARLSTDAPLDCEAYDFADMTVKLYPINTAYQSNSFPDGIYVTAYPTGEIAISPNENKPFSYYLYLARQYTTKKVNEYLSPLLTSVVTGVTLGDKVGIPDELYGQIKTAGVTHMFAVSGMHIAIFGQLLVMLLTALGVKRRRSPAYALAMVWLFIGVCGFPYSSIRAGIMFSIYALGLALFEQSDALNSLGIALLLISLPNPFCAMDIGLLLSASATLGIVLLSRFITDALKRFLPKIRWMAKGLQAIYNVIAVSGSATLFTAPILILSFGQISVYSILTNILLFLAPNVILFCTPLAVLFSLLHLEFLVAPLLFADGLAAKFMVFCVQKISVLPFALLSADENYLYLALAGCLTLIALWLLLAPGNRKLLRLTSIFCAVLLVVSIGSHLLLVRGVTRVYLTEDEQGVSALVVEDGHAALIGCGSEKNSAMRGLLSSKMIDDLDAIVFPSLDDAYAGGASRILDTVTTEVLYAPDNGTHRSQIDSRHEEWTAASLPQEYTQLWEGVSVRFDSASNALILRIGEQEIAFLVSPDDSTVSLSCAIAVAPEGLTSPAASTLLLTSQNQAAAASLAAQGAAVYTAGPDSGLCISSRGEKFIIRRS